MITLRRVVVMTAAIGLASTPPAEVQAQCPPYALEWAHLGPRSVAVDPDGDVYVANLSDRIQKFSAAGDLILAWGSRGTGNGQFREPNAVATDTYGDVFVLDFSICRVQKFTSTGNYIAQWGSRGSANGQFEDPWGLATDAAGNVYVADTGNDRIQKFTNDGIYLTQWGTTGNGDGQFDTPWAVATDSSGDVYVADAQDNRIQKFNTNGVYLTQWGVIGSGQGQFDRPHGVATDSRGDVYVSEWYNNRVQKFTSAGIYICQWGSFGGGDGEFWAPAALATDRSGNVFVADLGNERIQKFSGSFSDSLGPPRIWSFFPSAGPPLTAVEIRGHHFWNASSVTFNGQSATFSVISDSVITTLAPEGVRTGKLEVVGPGGSGRSDSIFIAPPEIAWIYPLLGPIGATVDIGGVNFTRTSRVEFNGIAATFVLLSDSLIRTTVPLSATDGPITVVNPGGSDTSDSLFKVTPTTTTGGGVNLSWDDCGTHGVTNKDWSCDANSGAPHTLVASFQPPLHINKFLGVAAEIVLVSSTSLLPDWWKHGSGECRGASGLTAQFDFTTGPFSCAELSSGLAAGGFAYDLGYSSPDRARIRVQYAVPYEAGGPLDPETEYYAFKVALLRAKSVGSGSCSGCADPVCLVLNEIQLFQPPELMLDPRLVNPLDRSHATWQNAAPDCQQATAVLVSVVSSEAESDRVRIVWQTSQTGEATIYRREGDQPWLAMARVMADGSRRITYEDLSVVAGTTYDYRLGMLSPGGEVFGGETAATVPSTVVDLAISRATWKRGTSGLSMSLTLPRSMEASVEVFDPNGRRWVRQRLEGLAAGSHVVDVGGLGSLRPGVYFARVVQGDASASRRFVVY